MSVWGNAMRAFQQAALLQYKVEQALTLAKDASRHSQETRDRLIQLETAFEIIVGRSGARQPRLPGN